MLFKDLYDLVVREFEKPPVSFDFLCEMVRKRHAGVGDIPIYAVSYPRPNRQAHYKLIGVDRSSGYDEEFDVAQIRYCEELDEHPRERRYALTKELMHVFDTDEEKVNTREKFIQFLKDVQNQPLAKHSSPMIDSEHETRWLAVIVLCPKPLRDQYYKAYHEGLLQPYEVADIFRVPEWVIPFAMDDYYDVAFDTLINKGT